MNGRLAIVALTLLTARVSAAQNESEPLEEQGPDYASEVRAPENRPLDRVPGFAESLDASTSAAEVTTVAQLLERSPGVRVQRLGGLDDFATVSVRGSSANQVLVLLDGVPLSSAQLQQVDVNAVAPDLLDRLEVYRSGAPVWLGLAPMGGAVNLVTHDVDEPLVRASLSYGSLRTRKATLMAAAPLTLEPAADLLVGATYRGTEGDFTFLDDRGTPLNPGDDATRTRRNNASNGGDLLVRTRVEVAPRLRLALQEALQLDRRGVPGLGQNQAARATYEHVRSLSQLSLTGLAWPADALDIHVRLYGDLVRDRFDDPDGEIGLGARDARSHGDAVGSQARLTAYPSAAVQLDAAVEVRWERFVSRDARNASAGRADAERVGVAPSLQATLEVLDERWLLVPGARLEHVASTFDGELPFVSSPLAPSPTRADTLWSAQLGTRVLALDGPNRLTLHGSVIRSARLPTFVELFGDSGAVIGNPALAAESALGGDLGATLTLGAEQPKRGRITVAGFAYRYDDLIQFVQNSQRSARPENIGTARITGLEVAAGLELDPWLALHGAYTFTATRDESGVAGQSGQRLPGRPRHDLYGSLTGRWWRVELTYELTFESENTLDRAGFRVVPARLFHGAGLLFRPDDHWTLGLDLDNLTDRRVEEVPLLPAPVGTNPTASQAVADYLGFPLPGRTVYATVQLEY